MGARWCVFGYGNPSRGDDALGPALLDRLQIVRAGWTASHAVELLTDFQLQIEHALDLGDRDGAVFVDASATCTVPFCFERLTPRRDDSYTTHALSPAAILSVFEQICERPAPTAHLLAIRGTHFELGQPLSVMARRNLAEAETFLIQWLDSRLTP